MNECLQKTFEESVNRNTASADAISPGATDHHQSLIGQFALNLVPVGVLESTLVAEIVRRAEGVARWSNTALAVQQSATKLLQQMTICQPFRVDNCDAISAIAISSDASERAERMSLSQSRALVRTIRLLLHLQDRRKVVCDSRPFGANPFPSEESCLVYLVRWRRDNFRCQRCGAERAHFIPSRRALECAACGAQNGLRTSTATADSPLPLEVWFAAIRFILQCPKITIRELQRCAGIRRYATARAVADKILAALRSEKRGHLLMDLDNVFEPESSVASHANYAKTSIEEPPTTNR